MSTTEEDTPVYTDDSGPDTRKLVKFWDIIRKEAKFSEKKSAKENLRDLKAYFEELENNPDKLNNVFGDMFTEEIEELRRWIYNSEHLSKTY